MTCQLAVSRLWIHKHLSLPVVCLPWSLDFGIPAEMTGLQHLCMTADGGRGRDPVAPRFVTPWAFCLFALDRVSCNRHNARLLRWWPFGRLPRGALGMRGRRPLGWGLAGRGDWFARKGVDIRAGCCRMVGLGCFRPTPGAGFFNSLVGQFEAGACAVGGLGPAAVAAFRGRARRKNAAMRRVKKKGPRGPAEGFLP